MPEPPIGRRERKKALTRQSISDAALRLFFARGFDGVTVAEIAEAADVSVSTLFQHFPSKESMVFGDEQMIETSFVAAVADRPPGTPILDALRDSLAGAGDREPAGPDPRLVALIAQTPSLALYVDAMWAQHADTLAKAIAADQGADPGDVRIRALARYVILVPSIARHDDDPAQAIHDIFDGLRDGWGENGTGRA